MKTSGNRHSTTDIPLPKEGDFSEATAAAQEGNVEYDDLWHSCQRAIVRDSANKEFHVTTGKAARSSCARRMEVRNEEQSAFKNFLVNSDDVSIQFGREVSGDDMESFDRKTWKVSKTSQVAATSCDPVTKIFRDRRLHDHVSSFMSLRSNERHFLDTNGVSLQDMETTVFNMNRPEGQPRPICATVAGPGRGKTHLLQSLTKRLNERRDTVAVPITFMGIAGMTINTHSIPKAAEILLCVTTLILRVVSRGEVDDDDFAILRDMAVVGAQRGRNSVSPTNFAASLLRGVMTEIKRRYSNKLGKDNITKFVLLVDEARAALSHFNVSNIQVLLSQTIVSTESADRLMEDLDGFLVTSALDFRAAGVKESDRIIFPLILPSHLDAREVILRWMSVNDPEWANVYESHAAAARAMELLISMVVRLPRAVEGMIKIAGTVASFAQQLRDDRNYVPKFFQRVSEEIGLNYQAIKGGRIDASVAYALVFQQSVTLTDTISTLISQSVLTNALKGLSNYESLVLETSAWNLWMLAKNTSITEQNFLEPVTRLMDGLLQHMNNSSAQAGGTLEIVVREVINLHLCVTAAKSSPSRPHTFQLTSLFHTCSTSSVLGKFEVSIGRPPADPDQRVMPNSYREADQFLRAANEVILGDGVGALEVALSEGEAADGLWLLRTVAGETVALFINIQSAYSEPAKRRESAGTASAAAVASGSSGVQQRRRFHWTQAEQIGKIAQMAANQIDSCSSHSLGEALANKRYVYVYLSPHARWSSSVNVDLNAEIVNQKRVFGMLGTFKEVYESARRFVCT